MGNIEDFYPLSPMQQGMLFHSLYAPNSGVYIQQMICGLHENLNVSAFKQAWRRVVDRHPIFRTSFWLKGANQPFQQVHRQVALPWQEHDGRGWSVSEREKQLETYLQEDRRQGFVLTQAPLIRLALFQMGEADYQFVWTSHHALLDGRSRFVVLQELFEFYEVFCDYQESALEPPRPYREYIEWLQNQDLSQAKAFWQERLQGFSTPTRLVVDQAPGKIMEQGMIEFTEQELKLSASVTFALQLLAQRHELTLNTLIQGAWTLLLSRYSGEEEVVFGATRAGRHSTLAGAESIVGLLINTLPVRMRVFPEERLLPWLKELRAQWVAMRKYEHTPLIKIQEWTGVSHRTSLFESIMNFEYEHLNATLQAQGGNWEHREFRLLQRTNYPLVLTACGMTRLSLAICYQRHRFEDGIITRMLRQIQTLLEGMVADPEQRLSDLPLLTGSERHQVLVEWNATQADYHRDFCIHQLFEAQVERTPDALALVFENQQLTYCHLNARANQLAHYLKKLGIGPEVLVGIYMERSVEMLIGLLGILKAGGAYVPLDPAYPKERLTFMLEDTQAQVVLTQEKLRKSLPELETEIVSLDSDWQVIAQESEENLYSEVKAENLAYVMYTSGSTGKPKGTMITHRGLVNYLCWCIQTYAVADGDGAPVQSSMSFDATITSLFSPLLVGKSVILLPEKQELDELAIILRSRRNLSLVKLTPAHLDVLNQLLSGEEIAGRTNVLIIGGEALSGKSLAFWRTHAPGTRLINEYGPTETVVGCCVYEVSAETSLERTIPIGRPIANTQLYILDQALQPVPIGVPGELYIGGTGLARGYLRRPELTAEKFIPHPFSREPGARLYKTGDIARYLPDGNIEFLGRLDQQVKIRGFRIELGEIEAVLKEYPSIQETVVTVWEESPEDRQLVAYFVINQGTVPTTSEFRGFLQKKLPTYMIPSIFVQLDTMPLTANGKIDRRALPKPDRSQRNLGERSIAPHTRTEKAIATIWAEILGVEQVGVNENFFELGGHSLLAMRVISRLSEVFQITLPLRSLFDAPTVDSLTQYIETIHRTAQTSQTPVVSVPRTGALPLSFAQQRMWFLHQLEGESTAYTVPIAVRLTGHLNTEALEQSLTEIVQRHEILRTTFPVVAGSPVQKIASTQTIPLPLSRVDLEKVPVTEQDVKVQESITTELRQSFDLGKGPLLRVTLFRLSATEHILLVTMHHIISDAWSMEIFFRELSLLYKTSLLRQPSPLPDLPIQYADFAYWQRQWLQGEVLQEQLTYWQAQLAGGPAVLNLPTDRPRPPIQTFQGSTKHFVLHAELTQKLEELSQQSGVTLFMTLLAAFVTLLARYSGQEDIAVGSPISNRNRREIESLIGFFVNTLVLRVDLSRRPTFLELLRRVREVTLGAYDHQDIPFEKLVEILQPERNLSHTPLFQVMFVLQNTPMTILDFPGLTVTPVAVTTETTKFDMTLSLEKNNTEFIGTLQYNTNLFNTETITRIIGHFQTLLASIAAHPDQYLVELPILTEAEKHQLLVEWNNTTTSYPKGHCIHELFEAQVEQNPDSIAVVFENQQLTYRELNCRANQLAHHLQTLDVGPDVLVGLYVERSIEMLVGILGILKAGGAYVPLDPVNPPERLGVILSDTQIRVLLTQQSLCNAIPEYDGHIICLDSSWREMSYEAVNNPDSGVQPDNLVYVIYTSGSSGRPKGTLVTHYNVVRLFQATETWFHFNQDDVWAFFHSYGFDFSVWEMWGALLYGGRLIVVPYWTCRSPEAFYRLLRTERVTVLNQTPSAFYQLMRVEEKLGVDENVALRLIIFGGEMLEFKSLRPWFELHGENKPQLVNMYGITETTVHVTYYPLNTIDTTTGMGSIIGRPIPDLQVYILNSQQNLMPIGMPGELYVGGSGLSRCYLNYPELTAQHFIPDPFSDKPGMRLYKTGDIARYLSDGDIEYLGRIDHQVKIRGFRVEFGEIEAKLLEHPVVREVVVTTQEKSPSDKQLIAYFIADQEPAPTLNELRNFLKEKLPDYMVPSFFVRLEAMPLTPSGKIDRYALPAPDINQPELTKTYVAPRNQREELLATIWADVLGLDRVGVYDNFFELGGHSLLATQLLLQIRKMFQIELSVRNFFQNPTIEGIARTIALIRQTGIAEVTPESPTLDLQAEVVLDPTIYPKSLPVNQRSELTAIFLTGTTGFVGAFLLHELLQQTQADMYCLVRATSIEAGQQKLQRHLESNRLWHHAFNSRIIPVVGDLDQPNLGMSIQQFHLLASQIDAIYHCGAQVNFLYPYDRLKPPNVLGTQEILRLAALTKAIPVHHISTTAVFNASSYYERRRIPENDALTYYEGLRGGYAQSKWVAEKIVMMARDRGLPTCIYRLGAVTGHSQTGVWNTNDYVCRFLKGCIQLGSMPDQDKVWRFMPVDYASKAIVSISRLPASLGKAFHIFSPYQIPQRRLFDWICALGYPLQLLPYDQWLTKLVESIEHLSEHELYPLLPFFEERSDTTHRELQLDCRNLVDSLSATAIICPAIDTELFSTYFSYFIRSNFLAPPPLGGDIEQVLKQKLGSYTAKGAL